jgi:hypothetical protein
VGSPSFPSFHPGTDQARSEAIPVCFSTTQNSWIKSSLDVYLYVGLRRGDAARLSKQHIKNGVIHLMTEKSQQKMPVYVPVHPALAASIKACKSPGLAIVCKDDGTHYSKAEHRAA